MTYIIAAISAAALVWLLELLFVQVRLLVCHIQMCALLRKRVELLEEKERPEQ